MGWGRGIYIPHGSSRTGSDLISGNVRVSMGYVYVCTEEAVKATISRLLLVFLLTQLTSVQT
jgi:hypothetical protein